MERRGIRKGRGRSTEWVWVAAEKGGNKREKIGLDRI